MEGSGAPVGYGDGATAPLQTGDFEDSDWMSLDDASSLLDAGQFELPTVNNGVLSPSKMVADTNSRGRDFGAAEYTTVLDMEAIRQTATVDFLTKSEVAGVLANFERMGMQVSVDAVQTPPSGSLIFYNKKTTKRFRDDGYDWRKKKGGRGVQEYHEKLKIGGVEVLTVCYTKLAADPDFQRRVYWLLEKERSHWVLVHYLRKQLVAPSALAPSVETAGLTDPISGLEMGVVPGSHLSALDAPMGTPLDTLAAPPGAATLPHPVMLTDPVATPMQAAGEEAGPVGGESDIHLVDCSPDWGYVDGGQKVIIVYDATAAVAAQNSTARYGSANQFVMATALVSDPIHSCPFAVCACLGWSIFVRSATYECLR
jgi:hypothetical protein